MDITRNEQALLKQVPKNDENGTNVISRKYYKLFCDYTGKIAHAEDAMYHKEILQLKPEKINAFLSELFIWINKFDFTLGKYEEFKTLLFRLEKKLGMSLFEIKTVKREIFPSFGTGSIVGHFEDIVPKEIVDPRVAYIIFNYIDNRWESDFFNVQLPRFLDLVNLYPTV
jgi:hypothetical protein